jgi:hypothetical protein
MENFSCKRDILMDKRESYKVSGNQYSMLSNQYLGTLLDSGCNGGMDTLKNEK